jgi:hypothetical protein
MCEKLDVGQRLLALDALKVVVVEREAQRVHNLQRRGIAGS